MPSVYCLCCGQRKEDTRPLSTRCRECDGGCDKHPKDQG